MRGIYPDSNTIVILLYGECWSDHACQPKKTSRTVKIMKQSETDYEKFGDWPYHLRQERGQHTQSQSVDSRYNAEKKITRPR
jgi:hypothetical protein